MLEHLSAPRIALQRLRTVLKPGGTLTVIEGDHGSAYFHPDSAAAREAIQALVTLQAQMGGNALIGRQLFPLLSQAGYAGVNISPCMGDVDASRPALVDGFTRKPFTAMVEQVREEALNRVSWMKNDGSRASQIATVPPAMTASLSTPSRAWDIARPTVNRGESLRHLRPPFALRYTDFQHIFSQEIDPP